MSVLRRQLLTLLPRSLLSKLVGRLASLPLPRPCRAPLYSLFAKAWGMDRRELDRPLSGFRSFQELFTRPLRDGVRPLEPATVVSPVDGRICSSGPLDGSRLLQVKGCWYELGELLQALPSVERFEGGFQITLHLAPGDYHRIHCPVEGRLQAWSHLPGSLFPVNPPALRSIPRVFCRNERLALLLEETPLGPVAMVLVGALNVGSIRLSALPDLRTNRGGGPSSGPFDPPVPVTRGQELGCFALGSTVILVFEKGRFEASEPGPGRRVLMGGALGGA